MPSPTDSAGCGVRPPQYIPSEIVFTRSQHVFFNQLTRDAGWVIDWSRIHGDLFAHARTLAIIEDHSGLDALIRPQLHPLAQAVEEDRVRGRTLQREHGFHGRARVRGMRELDAALDAAREERERLRRAD
jgi:cell filamentation protein